MNIIDELHDRYTKPTKGIDISDMLPVEISDEVKEAAIDMPFKIFDPSGLSAAYYDKVHKMWLPVFAMFNVISNEFILCYSMRVDLLDRAYSLERCVCHEQYFKALSKNKTWKLIGYTQYNIRTTFKGIIPQKTRDIIKDNRSRFNDIYIIADAQNQWEIDKKVTTSVNRDPLVVGYSRQYDKYFVLDKFDMTPSEEYLAREFATRRNQ